MNLRDEIFEQADVLLNLLRSEWNHISSIAEEIRNRKIEYIFLTARGTSDNAGVYAKYLFGIQNDIPVALAAPSMFSIYKSPPKLGNTLVLAVSQSGQSPDIIQVLEEGKEQGAMCLAITNAPQSPIAKAATHVIDIKAGVEKAVAATKTYTAQLLAIAMLSAAINLDEKMQGQLQTIPEFVSQALALEKEIQQAVARYYYSRQCVIVGRGYNYATAFEWALKLKELAYITAEPYSSADFLHGPIAMVNRDFPVFLIAPSGEVYQDLCELAEKLRDEKQANTMILSDQDDILKLSSIPMKMPAGIPEWISPIVNIIPAQLFCQSLASLRGLDTENPRGLSKVTLTL